jgi:hypothetical protein
MICSDAEIVFEEMILVGRSLRDSSIESWTR